MLQEIEEMKKVWLKLSDIQPRSGRGAYTNVSTTSPLRFPDKEGVMQV